MAWVTWALKFRDLAYLLVIAGLLVWVQTLRADIASDKLAQEQLIRKTQERADRLADELVIKEAIVMARNTEKAIQYVDRIRMVKAPDVACAADERMRVANGGVRDIIQGRDAKTSGQPAPGLPAPQAGSKP